MKSIKKNPERSIAMLVFACILTAGCSSYQDVALKDIEAKPEKFINEKAIVHFEGTMADTTVVKRGRSQRPSRFEPVPTAPDSIVAMRFDRIEYPVVTGPLTRDPKMYGAQPVPPAVSVDLRSSTRVETCQFSSGYTALVFFSLAMVFGFVAAFHSPPP